mgnify:CR=1 FL=1
MFSVIIPLYNKAPYIEKALRSVFAQTYTDYELIVVDDGSKDDSKAVAEQVLACCPVPFQLISQANAGVSMARNNGVAASQGDYICFLDSDDYLEPQFCELMLQHVIDGNHDFVMCLNDRVDADGNFLTTHKWPSSDLVFNDSPVDQFLGSDWFNGCYTWGKLYKRALFDHVRFVEGMYYEDNNVTIKILKNCSSIKIVALTLLHYRLWKNSITGDYDLKKLDLFKSYHICAQELKGTPWYKYYYQLSLRLWSVNWYACRNHPAPGRKALRSALRKVLAPWSKVFVYRAFTPIERVKIFLRYIYTIVYR